MHKQSKLKHAKTIWPSKTTTIHCKSLRKIRERQLREERDGCNNRWVHSVVAVMLSMKDLADPRMAAVRIKANSNEATIVFAEYLTQQLEHRVACSGRIASRLCKGLVEWDWAQTQWKLLSTCWVPDGEMHHQLSPWHSLYIHVCILHWYPSVLRGFRSPTPSDQTAFTV